MLLIEDCAHVLDSSIGGRRIGAIGDVSVFSFRKFFQESGGVVALKNSEAAGKIRAAVAAAATLLPEPVELRRYAQVLLKRATSPALVAPVSAIYRHISAAVKESNANGTGPALVAMPSTGSLMTVAGFLRRIEKIVADRTAATRQLVTHCPWLLKKSSQANRVCYLVVPFFAP